MLSEDERDALVGLQRATRVPAGVARRARAVLLMADAVSGVDVARLTGYTTVPVGASVSGSTRNASQGWRTVRDRVGRRV